jgi:AcrR family transcriptional regulator
MRAIAQEAGVSLGNAYYYFASKDQLIQGFYLRLNVAHAAESARRLEGVTNFAARLLAVEHALLDVVAPVHPFAAKLYSVASDPTNSLNPFSTASAPARQAATQIFRDVVAGADLKADQRVLAELPDLLWLAHMGVVLHWVHDRSPDQRRTRRLVDRAVPLIDKLVRLTRLRPLRPITYELLDLARDLRSDTEEELAGPTNQTG